MRRAFRFLLALAFFILPVCRSQHAQAVPVQGSSRKPSLLFVTIDTWRWDYMGASGSGRADTPAMDGLAGRGVYEPEILAPCPLTTPSHASMFTGLTPLKHRVLDCMSYSLPSDVPTLAEAFKKAGYKTAAVVSGDTLKRRFGLARGFDLYDDLEMQKRYAEDIMPSSRDGAVTTRKAVAWLRGLNSGDPAFLWVHYFDLHTPYRSRPVYDAKYPKNRYAAQVNFVDDQVAALVAAIGADPGRSWRIVVVGDHGEGFGEHGEIGHGYSLYRETLDVPFIVSPRPQAPLVHPRPWAIIDIEPTVREWFGLPGNAGVDGESLFKAGTPGRNISAVSFLASFMFNVTPVYGLRRGGMMYMKHADEELYDIHSDPGETRNISGGRSLARELETSRGICEALFPQREIQAILNPTLKSTQADLDSLRGLGYIQGSVPKLSEVQRVSLRTVLQDFSALQKSRTELKSSGDIGKLKETYDAFLRKYPRAASIYRAYGRLMLQNKDYESAFTAFDTAVRLNPNDPDSLLNLGTLYIDIKKDPRAAVVLLERSCELSEAEPITHLNLGIIFNDILKDPKKAYPHFKRFLELDPENEEVPKIIAVVKKMEAAGITGSSIK